MELPFGRKQREQELDEELDNHLRMAAQDRKDRGESAQDAGISARRELGNVDWLKRLPAKCGALDHWRLFWQDFAVRCSVANEATWIFGCGDSRTPRWNRREYCCV